MITLREFKVRFCDPVTTYLVGVAIVATGWLAKTLFDTKRCVVDGCSQWVRRNELYCNDSHKQY